MLLLIINSVVTKPKLFIVCIEKSAVHHSRYVNLSSLLECVIKYCKNEGPKPEGIGILSPVHGFKTKALL